MNKNRSKSILKWKTIMRKEGRVGQKSRVTKIGRGEIKETKQKHQVMRETKMKKEIEIQKLRVDKHSETVRDRNKSRKEWGKERENQIEAEGEEIQERYKDPKAEKKEKAQNSVSFPNHWFLKRKKKKKANSKSQSCPLCCNGNERPGVSVSMSAWRKNWSC